MKSELEKYLNEETEKKSDGFNILEWWKVNSLRFPFLSQMARNVLAVPISTVASESPFSTGGCVLDPFRSSLTTKAVQALICTQDWLRSQLFPLHVEEDLTLIQLNELEELEKEISNMTDRQQVQAQQHWGMVDRQLQIHTRVYQNKLTFTAAAKVSSSFPAPELPEIAFAGLCKCGNEKCVQDSHFADGMCASSYVCWLLCFSGKLEQGMKVAMQSCFAVWKMWKWQCASS